jgi:hypothetical protein
MMDVPGVARHHRPGGLSMAVDSDESKTGKRSAAAARGGAAAGEPVAEPVMLEPTDAEVAEWADRERRRRQAWLEGPTADERAAYARRERDRRLSRVSDDGDVFFADRARLMLRTPREMQLAAEGAMSLFLQWSRKTMTEFIEAGREWEDQFTRTDRRGRVPIDDDED